MTRSPVFLIILITAAFTAVVALVLAHTAWRKRPASGAVILMWLMLAVATWSSGVALAYATDVDALRLLGVKIAYFGVVSAPTLTFLFVLTYTGFSHRLERRTTPRFAPLLFIVPTISLFLALTYPWNRLLWNSVVREANGFTTVIYGPYKYFDTGYQWTLMICAALVMSWYAFSVRGAYRRRALLVAVAILLPIIPNVLYMMRLLPGPTVDLTFLGMLFSAMILLYTVERGSFLDVRPLAHDVLVEQMADAILVIDADLRVVDCNRAALVDLNLAQPPMGRPLPEVLQSILAPHDIAGDATDAQSNPAADLPDRQWSLALLMDALGKPESSTGDLVVARPMLRYLHWRISPVARTGMPSAGWILVWRDVTQDRLKLAMCYEQEQALRPVDPPLFPQLAGEPLASAYPTSESVGAVDALQLGLTDREIEILTLMVRGFTYQEIAVQLYVSARTVRYDSLEIRQRMGVASKGEMVEFAIKHNLVKQSPGVSAA